MHHTQIDLIHHNVIRTLQLIDDSSTVLLLTETDETLVLPNENLPPMLMMVDFESREDGRVTLLVAMKGR